MSYIDELEKEITPGPWKVIYREAPGCYAIHGTPESQDIVFPPLVADDLGRKDAEFIVVLRNSLFEGRKASAQGGAVDQTPHPLSPPASELP